MLWFRNRRKIAAFHEAGHAVVALALGVKFRTLFAHKDATQVTGMDYTNKVTFAIVAYGGIEATDAFYGIRKGGDLDNRMAQEVFDLYPESLLGESREVAEQKYRDLARQLIEEHHLLVCRIALALYERKHLTYNECLALIDVHNKVQEQASRKTEPVGTSTP